MAEETYKLKIELAEIGELKGEILRILSPITAERISKMLINKKMIATSGRYFIGGKDFFMIRINIKKGIEKGVHNLSRGDLAYEPSTDSLMISLIDGKTRTKVSKLGKITSGLEYFDKVNRNAGVKLSLI